MTDRELNIALREMARSIGACDKIISQWKDDDTIDMLLDRYVRTFDFALEKDFPNIDFIRANFRKGDLHRHHIYIDEEVNISDAENGYYVFLGNCTGLLYAIGFKAVTVLMRHDSNINVTAYDGARVQVRYYERSDGTCNSDSFSRISSLRK